MVWGALDPSSHVQVGNIISQLSCKSLLCLVPSWNLPWHTASYPIFIPPVLRCGKPEGELTHNIGYPVDDPAIFLEGCDDMMNVTVTFEQ